MAFVLQFLCQLADGGSLAHAVDADNQHHIRLARFRTSDVAGGQTMVVLGKQGLYLLAKHPVELGRAQIFLTPDTLLDATDDFDGRVYAYVRGDKHVLQIVKHILVDSRLAHHHAGNLVEKVALGLLQAFVKHFLLFLVFQKVEQSHLILNANW